MRRPIRPTLILVAVLAVLMAAGAVAVAAGPNEPPPRTAFVARSDLAVDALAAGPVAARYGAPLFTTPPDKLVPAARDGLVAYAPELVIIAGSAVAISETVEHAIEAATGLPDDGVIRAAGEDRHHTAQLLAGMLDDHPSAYLPIDGKAADADRLDGLNSTAFLRASTVTTSHSGSWRAHEDPGPQYGVTWIHTTVGGGLTLPLDSPVAIGNTTFKVASIEFCFATSNNSTVDHLTLYEATTGPVFAAAVWGVELNMSTDGWMSCVGPLTVDRVIGTGAGLLVDTTTGSGGWVAPGTVRVTWERG